MKKNLLLILVLIFLTGCSGLYNLNNFVLPDDLEFVALIKELGTPRKICQYMKDNFGFEKHPFRTLTPYKLFLLKKGDCDDFSNFATSIAHYHGYEVYQIKMKMNFFINHVIGVFKEDDYFNISNTIYYLYCERRTFSEIIDCFTGWISYVVYDYDNNIIETGYNN